MGLAKGIVRSYDGVTGRAEVELGGTSPYYVEVGVASYLNATQLVDGVRCAVLFFSDSIARDAVLVCVYDVVPGLKSGVVELEQYEASAVDTITTTAVAMATITNMSLTFTARYASYALCLLTLQVSHQSAGGIVTLGFTNESGATLASWSFRQNGADYADIRTLHLLTPVAAGSRTIRGGWYVAAGTARAVVRRLTVSLFAQ